MKTTIMLLSVGLFAALLPFATAEEGCSRASTTEAITHPLTPGVYYFIDLTQPEKVGEWTEKNGADGLQTINCMSFGVIRYRADVKVDLLG